MDYWLVGTGDPETVGIDGALSYRESLMNQPITLIIDVDDAVGYMEKVKANGGEVLGELQDIPGIGLSGYFKDPAGTIVGVMQSYT